MTAGDLTRDLAAALRGEASVRGAVASWVARWHQFPGFERAGHLVTLGCPIRSVVSELDRVLGREARALAALLDVADHSGCSAADVIDTLAASIDDREQDLVAGRAAATAARKSARAMVLMPLLGTPVLLLGGMPLTDAVGIGLAAIAIALMYAAWRWIDRLVPEPPDDDPALVLCDLVACALAGGFTPGHACSEIAPLLPRVTAGAARHLRLGFTWPEALVMSKNDILRRAGVLLLRQERSGTPVAQELTLLARGVRRRRRAAFDVIVKAAPVRMIWPLVVCSLPAFCALTLVPLVRGIARSL